MIVYPVIVEPHHDAMGAGFIARFPDIPEVMDCIGWERDDALSNAIERLNWALTDIFLAGKPQPKASPIGAGQLGIGTPLFWITL